MFYDRRRKCRCRREGGCALQRTAGETHTITEKKVNLDHKHSYTIQKMKGGTSRIHDLHRHMEINSTVFYCVCKQIQFYASARFLEFFFFVRTAADSGARNENTTRLSKGTYWRNERSKN